MFGRAGIKMNQVFGEGAEAFDAWIQKAEEMGFVVSGNTIKAVESFNDRFSELQFIASGLVNQTFAAMAPVLDTLITSFRDWIIEVNKTEGGLAKIGKEIATNLFDAIIGLIRFIGEATEAVVNFAKKSSYWLKQIGLSALVIAQVVGKNLVGALKTLENLSKTTPPELSNFADKTNKVADALEDLRPKIGGANDDLNDTGDAAGDAAKGLSIAAESLERFGSGFDQVFNNGIDKFEDMEKLGQKVGKTLEDGLTNAFMNIQTGAENLKDVMDNILKQIVAELIRVFIIQRAVGAVGTFFGFPGMASGGPVSAGKTYLVGEKGPELFTPGQSGGITPNHQLAAVGGGATNINITYDIKAFDAKDATAAIAEQAPTIVGIVEQSFRKRGKRGPLGA